MGGGRIEVYLDIASLYSYFAFYDLLKNQATLEAHGVTLEFHPVLLGAINAGSGNKPPWTLPAKATYGNFDARRSAARVGKRRISPPADLMAVSLTVLPLRALHHIARTYPRTTFQSTFHYLFHRFWTAPNANLADAQVFAQVLADMPVGFDGDDVKRDAQAKQFSEEEIRSIVAAAGSAEMKDLLKRTTQEALDRGAFGAPWMWVTNDKGKAEPFFGSDRFHFVYKFLGVPFHDVKLLAPEAKL